MSPTIYLDLDGVMADFDGYFHSMTLKWPHEVSDDELWEWIHAHRHFFFQLPTMTGAWSFLNWMRKTLDKTPIIITACPQTNYAGVARDKKAWVQRHLGYELMVLPVRGGPNKALFMHKPGDILIDDFEKNCNAWRDAGGVAIQHKDFPTTKQELVHALYL